MYSKVDGGRLPILSARPAVAPATLKRPATNSAEGDWARPHSCKCVEYSYTYADSDVISFHIYASWFPQPSCG